MTVAQEPQRKEDVLVLGQVASGWKGVKQRLGLELVLVLQDRTGDQGPQLGGCTLEPVDVNFLYIIFIIFHDTVLQV